MTNEFSDGERIQADLRAARRSFEQLLLALETEGPTRARGLAENILTQLERASGDIRTTYTERVLTERFRVLGEDRRRLAELREDDDLVSLVSRLERHLKMVERELRVLVLREPRIVGWVRRHRRPLAAAVLSVTALTLLVLGVRKFMTRGQGLVGMYHDGINFDKAINRRKDLSINLSLRRSAPIRGLGPDRFSVRWTGQIRIPEDGAYEFVTRSDDGVRLWVGGELLIENWTIHRQTTDRATRQLKAGSLPIQLEWYQAGGGAEMKLYWRYGNEAQPRLIEPEFLSPPRS